jgi:hypothetical protein
MPCNNPVKAPVYCPEVVSPCNRAVFLVRLLGDLAATFHAWHEKPFTK